MRKTKKLSSELSDKSKKSEDVESNIISDFATDLYEMLPSRKDRDLTKEEEDLLEKKKRAREEAAGKLAGWGDYKFDWEK